MIVSDQISGIDGWRAVSVTIVIISHLLIHSSVGTHSNLVVTIFNAYGVLGVRMFFVISGFVICRGFIHEQAANKRISIEAFYIRRAFRILPPLIIYLLTLYLLAITRIVSFEAVGALKGLLFVCDIKDCGGYLGNHQWSLAVEEQFYIVFPLLFLFARYRPTFFLVLLLTIPTASLVLAIYKYAGEANFISGFVYICIGVVCAFYERQLGQFAAKIPPSAIVGAILAALIISPLPPGRASTLLLSFGLPVLIAFVLLATTLVKSRWDRFLSARPVVIFGRISYGVYLWQQLANYPFLNAGYMFYVFSLSACIIFCLCSFYYFERPLIAFSHELSRQLQGRRAPNAQRAGHA